MKPRFFYESLAIEWLAIVLLVIGVTGAIVHGLQQPTADARLSAAAPGVMVRMVPTAPIQTLLVDLDVANDAAIEFTRNGQPVRARSDGPILLRDVFRLGLERHEIDPYAFTGAAADNQEIQVTLGPNDVRTLTVADLRAFAKSRKTQIPVRK